MKSVSDNNTDYILYHESNPLESEMIIHINKTGKVLLLVKKLKPFCEKPYSSSAWQEFKEEKNLDPDVFFEFKKFLKDNNFESSSNTPFPGASTINIKICLKDFKCKSLFLSSMEDQDSFEKIKHKIDVLIFN